MARSNSLGFSRFLGSCGALRFAAIFASLAGAAGCVEGVADEDVAEATEAVESENGLSPNGLSTNGLSTNGLSTNGLSTNGLSTNGLSTNGLSTNGLSTNGLSTNGLSTNGFAAWFNSNPESYSDNVMRYVVRCAVAEGETRTFVSSSGATYTWTGLLGLAPSWSAGGPIPLVEQQLVSACLAAHVNKFGLHVDISVRGLKADGSAIPVTQEEREDFDLKEACFFGNIFNGEGVFAAPFKKNLTADDDAETVYSSPRACGITEPWDTGDCSPYLPRLAGRCSDYCSGQSGATFASCTYNGVSYKPITTKMRSDDLYECGDGVCQITEVPYSQSTGLGCGDCGTEP